MSALELLLLMHTYSFVASISKYQSEHVSDKLNNRSASEEEKLAEENSIKPPASNLKLANGTSQSLTKRLERRSNVPPSPFGPSRGAKLLEMANKKSKLGNNLSSGSSHTLNSSSDLNSSGGSGSDMFMDIVENSSAPSLSKFVLMSPRTESRHGITSPLHSAPKTQEKVRRK